MYYTTKVGKLRVEKKNRSNKYINNRLELAMYIKMFIRRCIYPKVWRLLYDFLNYRGELLSGLI